MELQHLSIQNFMSYDQAELNLANRGLVLVEGVNGAGKSALFEAICWVLYNKTMRGLKHNSVCREGFGDTCVILRLNIDDTLLEVRRHREHSVHSNKLILIANEVDISASTDKETQLKLVSMLQLDWSTFLSVVLFPQGAQGFASYTDAEQKYVLEQVLSINRFTMARDRAKAYYETFRRKWDLLQGHVRALGQSIEDQEQQLAHLSGLHAGFADKKAGKVAQLQTAFENHQRQPPEDPHQFAAELARLQKQIAAGKAIELRGLETQCLQKVSTFQYEHAGIASKLQELHRLEASIMVVDPEVELSMRDTCPACEQTLPQAALQNLRVSLETDRDLALEDKARLSERRCVAQERKDFLDVEIASAKALAAQATEMLTEVRQLESTVASVERKLQDADWSKKTWDKEGQLLKEQLATSKKETSPYKSLIDDAQINVSAMRANLRLRLRTAEPLQIEIEQLQFWIDGFGNRGVKSLLLDTVVPHLNDKANEYMSALSNGTAKVWLSTQTELASGDKRDRFNVEVRYQYGSGEYKGISGGERRRADIAILFALGDLAATRAQAPVRLRLLDEPFESLDTFGNEQIVSLLRKKILPQAGTILTMSHDESMKALFDQRILVVKEDGVSRIFDFEAPTT